MRTHSGREFAGYRQKRSGGTRGESRGEPARCPVLLHPMQQLPQLDGLRRYVVPALRSSVSHLLPQVQRLCYSAVHEQPENGSSMRQGPNETFRTQSARLSSEAVLAPAPVRHLQTSIC
mmetsp:Transcript_36291/g.95191  ORF Transcript_36291/g.95191 Transcript_36291/m.95191 type:complete len:119 (-) Transcript_36291:2119-2475(-)